MSKLEISLFGPLQVLLNGTPLTTFESAKVRALLAYLAAENARLLISSQKRAAKEQTIGEAASEIGASINIDNILRTAVREMGRILPGADISIQVSREEQ